MQEQQSRHPARLIGGLSAILSGEGRRIVFIHGVGSHKESWDGVIERLGSGCQSLRYDLRGHGESEKTRGPYSLNTFCRDLDAIAAGVNWGRFDLVGFSLGGLIAQAYALHAPQAVRSLTILSSVCGRTEEERLRVCKRADTLAGAGADSHLETAVDRWFTDAFRQAHPEIVQARMARSRQNDPHCYAQAYRVLADNDLADAIHGIGAPTLVATGEQDSGSTPRMARLMAERIAGAKLHIFPRLRHSILLEAPDQVAAALAGFLAGVPDQ